MSSYLTSPATATRRFIMQKARRHTKNGAPTACRRMVSGSLSLPSSGFFSPFPHGTGTLSVSREYLALPDGPGGFAQDYSCPALLRIPLGCVKACVRDSHSLRSLFPGRSARMHTYHGVVLLPLQCIATPQVWAPPRSLATTGGITVVFFSSGY